MRFPATKLLLTLLGFSLVSIVPGHADSNILLDRSLSWGPNVGWLNWSGDGGHGVAIDQFVCSGYIYAANLGWIDLGNGAPQNRMSYQNNSTMDFGINVSERGELSGLAYGANIGWISFAAIGQPRIDLNTGRLSGFAYGANVGWISLGDSTYILQIDSLADGTDSDQDGIPDAWEISHAGSLSTLTAKGDFDEDGHSDLEEYLTDTDPTDSLDHLRIVKLSLSPDHSSTILTWSTRATRQYMVDTRSSLGNTAYWKDAGLGLLTASGPSLSREVPQAPGSGQQFFRIRAVRPLSP
jgi:hypothetical protein